MATVNRAAKARLYPNKAQTTKINQTLGSCRYVYNAMLARNKKAYERRKEHLYYNAMQNLLPGMKKYLPWLAEADSQALKYACRQVDIAYGNFFKHKADFPKFHKKHGRQAYTTTNNADIHVSDDRRKVKLPCLGWVKVRGLYIPDDVTINKATISREPDGTYYVSINYKYEADIDIAPKQYKQSLIIGLDYKSNGLYMDSNGYCAEMPHWFCESQAKLARQQRILSRRQGSRKGEKKSSGWIKQRQKVNRIYHKIANQRKDFLHKESKRLADTYDVIGVEALNMRAMSNKGYGNGKATLDNGYGMFLTMLEYKLSVQGKQLVKADRWYPSSQTCSCCGYRNKRLKNTQIRKWTCPQCGTHHDRDINAAINIKNEAVKMLKAS